MRKQQKSSKQESMKNVFPPCHTMLHCYPLTQVHKSRLVRTMTFQFLQQKSDRDPISSEIPRNICSSKKLNPMILPWHYLALLDSGSSKRVPGAKPLLVAALNVSSEQLQRTSGRTPKSDQVEQTSKLVSM